MPELKIVYEEELVLYYASYVATAESMRTILVTEDEKLLRAASNYVKAITTLILKTTYPKVEASIPSGGLNRKIGLQGVIIFQ